MLFKKKCFSKNCHLQDFILNLLSQNCVHLLFHGPTVVSFRLFKKLQTKTVLFSGIRTLIGRVEVGEHADTRPIQPLSIVLDEFLLDPFDRYVHEVKPDSVRLMKNNFMCFKKSYFVRMYSMFIWLRLSRKICLIDSVMPIDCYCL